MAPPQQQRDAAVAAPPPGGGTDEPEQDYVSRRYGGVYSEDTLELMRKVGPRGGRRVIVRGAGCSPCRALCTWPGQLSTP